MSLTGTKGGSGVWQRIISEMPEHDVYIEPFWGRGTIARKKRPAWNTIGIDMDLAAVSDGEDVATMFLADGIQWLADYFKLLLPLETATQYSPAGAAPPGGASGSPITAAAHATTFGGVAGCRHFVYIDPPYLGVPRYYKHILSVHRHRILCRLFLRLPAPAALSGYHHPVLDAELAGCRSIEIPSVNRAGNKTVEVLWMNYPQPTRYHDVRFAGNGRRDRERILRRTKTWAAALRRMKPPERQAVFEACAAVYHAPRAPAKPVTPNVRKAKNLS